MAGHKSSQQQIEHLLFGSVSEEELKPLLDRLRGLCDFATTGGVPFTDREIAYKIGMLQRHHQLLGYLKDFIHTVLHISVYDANIVVYVYIIYL